MERKATITMFRGLTVHKVIELVMLADQFESSISFSKNNQTSNGKSILGVMSLLIMTKVGEKCEIIARGDDASDALDKLTKFLENIENNKRHYDYYHDEGVQQVNKAMIHSLSSWTPEIHSIAKSYLKTTKSHRH
ncbi:HPr family phosphocarrier protein [Desertibacillus haloalkaliphilus]|uniref:HPr family phosphocarrier protein n=1 Tax=Desertibacillus haloalkaliphilus TaxID=1328930 RepID=UPI001C267B2F|nr:HPr family phosphocarrier protein [Desertibacillus haloalkaliphilus]MBU8906785.1 HPr family phosphocarrier protein [Desertibacillus haloalkaliphilus]